MVRQGRGFCFLGLAVVISLAAVRADGQDVVRRLAPGVVTVIAPEPLEEETFQGPIPLTNITKLRDAPEPPYSPPTYTLAEMASQVVLRRNIWNLEFAFKPLRMAYVDIPQPSGKMQRKLIWYMVYRVKNKGSHLTPVPEKDNFGHTTFKPGTVNEILNYTSSRTSQIHLFPHFIFRSLDRNKEYLDRIIPVAIPVIQKREMRGGKLYNSVEITKVQIPVSTAETDNSVWGVVTWEDVDPRTKFLSIYVQGLTNAYRLEGTTQGVAHRLKTLQLNFWRPGDPFNETEEEIRYGVPAFAEPVEQARVLAFYNLAVRVDHLWVYR